MYVLYHKQSTKIVDTYANERAAKAGLTRKVNNNGFNRSEYAITDASNFYANIEKTEVRHGVGPAHGKSFTVSVNTPWYSGPWSDAYWQN